MRTFVSAGVFLALVACLAVPAQAQQKGLGLGVGLSSSTYTEPGLTIEASGPTFNVDFQIPMQPNVTLNPFLLIAMETGEDFTVFEPGFGTFVFGTEFDYQVIGLQARYWVSDALFFGGQLAKHDVKVTVTEKSGLGSGSFSDSDTAIGFAAGGQLGPSLGVLAQYDSFSSEGSDYSSLRVLLTYRFAAN